MTTHHPRPRPAPPTTHHILRVDYTTKSAQIIHLPTGRCLAHYGPLHGRDAAVTRITADGWHLTPGTTWTYTTPPDGREHPVHPTPKGHPMPQRRDDNRMSLTAEIITDLIAGLITAALLAAFTDWPFAPHCLIVGLLGTIGLIYVINRYESNDSGGGYGGGGGGGWDFGD